MDAWEELNKIYEEEEKSNDLLIEMTNVIYTRVKTDDIDFSFYFSKKNSNHGIRVKICWNDKIIPEQCDTLQLFGNYNLIKNSHIKDRPDEQSIKRAVDFFKKYKVLFAAVWEGALYEQDLVDYFFGRIDLPELIEKFGFQVSIDDSIKQQMLACASLEELESTVRKLKIYNMND